MEQLRHTQVHERLAPAGHLFRLLLHIDDLPVADAQGYQSAAGVVVAEQYLRERPAFPLRGLRPGQLAPGECELLCLPLLRFKGDAGPCWALLRPL